MPIVDFLVLFQIFDAELRYGDISGPGVLVFQFLEIVNPVLMGLLGGVEGAVLLAFILVLDTIEPAFTELADSWIMGHLINFQSPCLTIFRNFLA